MTDATAPLRAAVATDDDDDDTVNAEPFDDDDGETFRMESTAALRTRATKRRVTSRRSIERVLRIASCVVCSLLGASALIVGAVLVGHANLVTSTAYAPALCRIVREHSLESTCAYYNVTLATHNPGVDALAPSIVAACGVPANVARDSRPGEPIACNDAVASERARYANATDVECYAPRSTRTLVDASRCASAATSSGALAELYHARADDFVYLGTIVEGRAALYAATQVQRETGGWLIAGGAFALAAIAWLSCWSSTGAYFADIAERAERLAAARRLHGPIKTAVE